VAAMTMRRNCMRARPWHSRRRALGSEWFDDASLHTCHWGGTLGCALRQDRTKPSHCSARGCHEHGYSANGRACFNSAWTSANVRQPLPRSSHGNVVSPPPRVVGRFTA
jgi:hypothetical protein